MTLNFSEDRLGKLVSAIRDHRRALRPSQRRPEDIELYQALADGVPPPDVIPYPPAEYAQAAENYYDAPY